nr:MAG TPA: hypothetical protein [Caudoviricetes sp.]
MFSSRPHPDRCADGRPRQSTPGLRRVLVEEHAPISPSSAHHIQPRLHYTSRAVYS